MTTSEADWKDQFADAFFDLFVEYELKFFNARVMVESTLYEIAYTNAENAIKAWYPISPADAARSTLESIMKEANK